MMTSGLKVLTVTHDVLDPWTKSPFIQDLGHLHSDFHSPDTTNSMCQTLILLACPSTHVLSIMVNGITCHFAIQTQHLRWILTYLIYFSSVYIYWVDFQIMKILPPWYLAYAFQPLPSLSPAPQNSHRLFLYFLCFYSSARLCFKMHFPD